MGRACDKDSNAWTLQQLIGRFHDGALRAVVPFCTDVPLQCLRSRDLFPDGHWNFFRTVTGTDSDFNSLEVGVRGRLNVFFEHKTDRKAAGAPGETVGAHHPCSECFAGTSAVQKISFLSLANIIFAQVRSVGTPLSYIILLAIVCL